ncbi:amidohydrolase family protein [Candidatus Berkiella aquae]|uniref:Amidohydrolase n=1 Tax=Candidatus Berkiella aquae TaxID=295108 RepID=A0A0Q9YXF9_9GAMM|nr:amidohydrolase [Candidatus Berkiella aquae]MCS5711596.1 amidohydrolase [Candidatus Berkiella aquae]
MSVDLIIYNGNIQGYGTFGKNISAAAIKNKTFIKFGSDQDIMKLADSNTRKIDLKSKTVIPGLNDSHLHLIRGGLNFNMELRWDGVKTLGDALMMLKEQARRTPPPQWVRVVGGWNEFQFKERRMPTLKEINEASNETPVFILHLYDSALLNKAALHAIGYDKNTQELPGTKIERDANGNPTGLLIAHPNAVILYSALAMGPKLSEADQVNSTLHFMRELNRLGVTSVCDAGGGFQRYPEDYQVIEKLNNENKLTVRIAYNLFTQKPKQELEDFQHWTKTTTYQQGNDYYHHNGAGEMLVFSAADFEDFLQPRPDLPESMEKELEPVVSLLAQSRWPFRLHATYDESIARALTVFETIDRQASLKGLNWFFDHAETISDHSIERVNKLGGGIAIQNRMAFQGEYFIDRYGKTKTLHTPPVKKILNAEIPVGLGTDATRVSSYNPWLCLYWITAGKSIGGEKLYDESNILSREEALTLYTKGSAWFSNEENKKGSFVENQLADCAVLSKDYFTVGEEDIKEIVSVLTIVGGEVVHASDEFSELNPPLPAVSPDWSPLALYGTYGQNKTLISHATCQQHHHNHHHRHEIMISPSWGGCYCWAF